MQPPADQKRTSDIKDFLDPLVLYVVSLYDESGQKERHQKRVDQVSYPKSRSWKAANKQLVIDREGRRDVRRQYY
jgi:hypothetical protein